MNIKETIIKKEIIIIILGFLGLLVATYLTYEHYTGNTNIQTSCPVFNNGCSTVANSEYSVMAGVIPIALLGVFYYISIISFCLLYLFKKQEIFSTLNLAISSTGFLFSVYLLYLQYSPIGAFCFYCVLSATITILIFLIEIPKLKKFLKK